MPKTTKSKAPAKTKSDPKLTIQRTVYILAPRKRVWRALTAPLETPAYYFGMRLETKLRREEPFRYVKSDGKVAVDGELTHVEPETKLSHTFSFTDSRDPASRVTWNLSDVGPKITRLELVHDGFSTASKTFKECHDGWDRILSGLKTWIETNGNKIDWPAGM